MKGESEVVLSRGDDDRRVLPGQIAGWSSVVREASSPGESCGSSCGAPAILVLGAKIPSPPPYLPSRAFSPPQSSPAPTQDVDPGSDGGFLGMDLGSCYLGGNADAVEFCPHSPFHNVLATATYTLQEHEEEQQKQDHAGTVPLFSVDAGAEDAYRRLRLLHTVETAGIFDMKWSPAAASRSGAWSRRTAPTKVLLVPKDGAIYGLYMPSAR